MLVMGIRMSTHLERFDQAVTVLTLTLGLCLMWEGYADLSAASNAAISPAHYDGTAQFSGCDISSPTASGGNRIQVTLTFSDLTPRGGAVVKMTSTDPSVVPVSDVPVPAGSKSWQFSIPINPTNTSESVIITAKYGGISKSVVVMVR
jgi:hypothetical protein